MKRFAVLAAALSLASPAVAQEHPARSPARAEAPPVSQTITLDKDMPVYSSDGVLVAETYIVGDIRTFEGNRSFFTEAPYFSLKRIYPREAWVDGRVLRLRMTAAQYLARGQNPPPGV